MSVAFYAVSTLFTALAIVYGLVILFSHQPRAALPKELLYATNDDQGMVHPLPEAINSSRAPKEAENVLLSVVVPCYNETSRLGRMVKEAVEYLDSHYSKQYEILVVDDGSSDGTAEYALELANSLKLAPHVMRVVKLQKNRGKGGAVRHGLLHGSGKFMLFVDADGATQFSDVEKLLQNLQGQPSDKPAVAIGLRAHMVNTDAVVKRSFIRNFLMYGLHTLVFIFGIRKIQDTQCGFKMFNRPAVQLIFPHMHTERWIFDVEVLLLADLQNTPIAEIPVNWQEIDGSKVDLAKDSIQMAIDLVVTRLAYLLGVYALDECGHKRMTTGKPSKSG